MVDSYYGQCPNHRMHNHKVCPGILYAAKCLSSHQSSAVGQVEVLMSYKKEAAGWAASFFLLYGVLLPKEH
jgi:hypothetical protein